MQLELRRCFSLIVGLAVMLACGCGAEKVKRPPLGKVKGVVTYKGNPVSDAIVTFAQDKASRMSVGMTDDDGAFKLTTFDTNDGAIVGTNMITVTKSTKVDGGKEPAMMKPEDLAAKTAKGGMGKPSKNAELPAKYATTKTSLLKEDVKPGKNEFEIKLVD